MRLRPSYMSWASRCNRLTYREPTMRLLVYSDSSRAAWIASTPSSLYASLSIPLFLSLLSFTILRWCFTSTKVSFCHCAANEPSDLRRSDSCVAVTDMFTISSAYFATLRLTKSPRENCFSSKGKVGIFRMALISCQCTSSSYSLASASTVGMVAWKSNTISLRYCTAVLPSGKLRSHNRTVLACFYDLSRISATSISSNGDTCQIWMFSFHSWMAVHSLTW